MKHRVWRHLSYAIAAAIALTGSACGNSAGISQAASAGIWSEQTRVPGAYLVTLADGAQYQAITDVYGRFGIKDRKDLGNNVYLVTLTEDPGLSAMEKLRGANTLIKAVQPNYRYRTRDRWRAQ